MTEYISDHEHRRPAGGAGWSPRQDRDVEGDHLLMMHLLYVKGSGGRGAPGYRNGYASLDSLREVSGLPAWRVWELVDDLQELGLASCIWDSRASRAPAAPSSASAPGSASGDLRFLRCTQIGLTEAGHSYPPLREYHRLRTQRRWETSGLAPGRTRQRQTHPRRRYLASKTLQWKHRPSRAYHVYRPQAQAARRLGYLAVALGAVVLTLAIYVILALT